MVRDAARVVDRVIPGSRPIPTLMITSALMRIERSGSPTSAWRAVSAKSCSTVFIGRGALPRVYRRLAEANRRRAASSATATNQIPVGSGTDAVSADWNLF